MSEDLNIFDEEELSATMRDNEEHEENVAKEKGKVHHYRYTDQDDINILKEVVTEKPVGKATMKWREIYDRLGIPVKDYLAIRRRFELLLKHFKTTNAKLLRGSGLEEDYNEKMRLLTDIRSQMDEWVAEESDGASSAKKKVEEQQKRAQMIRKAAMDSMKESSVDDADVGTETQTPKRKRRRSNELIELIKASEEREHQQKDISMDFEKRRLDLMERELKLKEENDQHRREMEKRRMEFDEKKLEIEAKRSEQEVEEKKLLMKMLQNKM